MNFNELLRKRRSTRQFDPSVAIDRDELTALLDAACRAPSGNNAQPWRFVVITDAALREKLLPLAYNQQQILTASAVVLLLADCAAYQRDNLACIHQEEFADGCFSAEVRDFLTEAAVGFCASLDEAATQKWLHIDCALWAMNFMLAAEDAGWQTVPMGGYQPAALRELLAIPSRYLDVMLFAIGKGSKEGHRTLRRPAEVLLGWNALPTER